MFAYGTLGAPTNHEVRELLRQWQARNRWPWVQVGNAMRAWGMSNVPGADRLAGFAASRMQSLHEDALRSLRRFLMTFPQPDSYDALIEQLSQEFRLRVEEERGRPMRETEARERQRAEHVRFWLAQERRPRVRVVNPLLGLDRATIAALSGGTM